MEGWDRLIVRKLWKYVDRDIRYNFRTGSKTQMRLRAILDLPRDFFLPHPEHLNLPLRQELASHLRACDEQSVALARWIIIDWGHISGGLATTIPEWMRELDDFNDERTADFIADKGAYRISSWSKLLAFADHKWHAIYDARTSVALNCALRNLGDNRQFQMPLGRNRVINAAQRHLLKDATKTRQFVGYAAYIELLRSIVKYKMSDSILAAEMVIFANAPRVAQEFMKN
jgi:hypothetical protein